MRNRPNKTRRAKARIQAHHEVLARAARESGFDGTVRGGLIIPRMARAEPAQPPLGLRAIEKRAGDGDEKARRYLRRVNFRAAGIRGTLLDLMVGGKELTFWRRGASPLR